MSIWVSELWEVSDRPVFVKGGPAHGTCCIILCDIFFHFVSDYEISALQRGHERFVVFTVVMLKIQVLWDVMLCHWPNDKVISQKVSVFRQKHSQLCNNLQDMKDQSSQAIL